MSALLENDVQTRDTAAALDVRGLTKHFAGGGFFSRTTIRAP